MRLPSLPPLPFTVMVELPTAGEVRGWLRSPWPWLALLIAAGVTGLIVVRHRTEGQGAARTAVVDVSSTPVGAQIMVDGRRAGRTPAVLSVPAGARDIRLQRPGYAEAAYNLHVLPDGTAHLASFLWRSHPAVSRLRPPVPGTTFSSARFLDDGRVALTATFPSGKQQVWITDATAHSQLAGPSAPAARAAVSSDGRLLATATGSDTATFSNRATQVWVSAVSGRPAPRKLYALDPSSGEAVSDLAWAPDGKHLLAAVASQGADGSQTRFLWLGTRSGKAARQLAQTPGEVVSGSESWAPDGQAVALLIRTQTSIALCLIRLPGGQLRDLADTGQALGDPLPFAPITWSPDGQHLLYQAGQAGSSGSFGWFSSPPDNPLIEGNIDGSLPRRRTAPPAQFPLWRPDGSIVGWARVDSGKPLSLISLTAPNRGESLAQLPLLAGSAFGARWDPGHHQALVSVSGGAGFGPPEYWLIRFAPEGAQ